jgi:hypothetical protein
MSKFTGKQVWDFRGNPALPWTITDTSNSGTPTYAGVSLGGLELAFDNTSEVQNVCLSFADKLAYDIDDLIRIEWIAKVGATALDTATTIVMGMGSARNDDPDAVAANAYFKLAGSNTLVVESDDGTTDNDDIATGDTLSTTFKRFAIDFSKGVYSKEPPSLSVGGKGAVEFYVGNARGQLRRVASGTRFDMSAYTAGLQPYFQIQKTADTNTDSLTILQVSVEYRLPV